MVIIASKRNICNLGRPQSRFNINVCILLNTNYKFLSPLGYLFLIFPFEYFPKPVGMPSTVMPIYPDWQLMQGISSPFKNAAISFEP